MGSRATNRKAISHFAQLSLCLKIEFEIFQKWLASILSMLLRFYFDGIINRDRSTPKLPKNEKITDLALPVQEIWPSKKFLFDAP
jgi:hypothetical protein